MLENAPHKHPADEIEAKARAEDDEYVSEAIRQLGRIRKIGLDNPFKVELLPLRFHPSLFEGSAGRIQGLLRKVLFGEQVLVSAHFGCDSGRGSNHSCILSGN